MGFKLSDLSPVFKSAEERQNDAISKAVRKTNEDYKEMYRGFSMYEDNPQDFIDDELADVFLEGYKKTVTDYLEGWSEEGEDTPSKETIQAVENRLRMYPDADDFFGQGEKGKISIFKPEHNEGYEAENVALRFFDHLRETHAGRSVLTNLRQEAIDDMTGSAPAHEQEAEPA